LQYLVNMIKDKAKRLARMTPFFLLILSFFLVFYKFTNIPKYLAFDEIEFTKLALSLDGKSYTPYSSLATGHSTLYFYILLWSLKLFGINTFALRLPAAIFGVLSVIMFYLVAHLSFRAIRQSAESRGILRNDIMPFLLTFIFLTLRWFLNFSRFAFEPTFLLFLELTSIYFFIRTVFIRTDPRLEGLSLILSGIFAGLAFNSYTPGRIFFLLPLGFLIFKKYGQDSVLSLRKQLFLFLISFIITIIPLTSYLMTHKESRVDQQFFLKNSKMTVNEKVSGLWQNVSSTTLMFFTKGDLNGRHNYPGKPALNPILGILFVLGLMISIKNWKNPYNIFSIFYLLFSIIPTLMTYPWENPNMLRTFTAIPSVVYFVGVAINKIGKKTLFFNFLFFIITMSSFYELRTYFKYQAKVFESSFEIKYPLEKAIKMKNVYEKID